jgi:hypothetical protein
MSEFWQTLPDETMLLLSAFGLSTYGLIQVSKRASDIVVLGNRACYGFDAKM